MPCLRQTSALLGAVSPSWRMATISASLYRFFFTSPSTLEFDSHCSWYKVGGAGHSPCHGHQWAMSSSRRTNSAHPSPPAVTLKYGDRQQSSETTSVRVLTEKSRSSPSQIGLRLDSSRE